MVLLKTPDDSQHCCLLDKPSAFSNSILYPPSTPKDSLRQRDRLTKITTPSPPKTPIKRYWWHYLIAAFFVLHYMLVIYHRVLGVGLMGGLYVEDECHPFTPLPATQHH